MRVEQIEKRRAEVNEEMADIVNRFEAATETLQPSEAHNDSTLNNSLEQSSADNHMDQSEDDNYHKNNFKSVVSKRNDDSNHGMERDDSSNDDADTNDEGQSQLKKGKQIVLTIITNSLQFARCFAVVSIKVEKDDESFLKSEANERVSEPQQLENNSKPQRSRSSSQT